MHEAYLADLIERAQLFAALQREVGQPCHTPDGRRVGLLANIEIPEEIPAALASGAEGVGLYRSEFLYVNRADLPNEHVPIAERVLGRIVRRHERRNAEGVGQGGGDWGTKRMWGTSTAPGKKPRPAHAPERPAAN